MVYYYSSLWLDLVHLNNISAAPLGAVIFAIYDCFMRINHRENLPDYDVIGEIAIYSFILPRLRLLCGFRPHPRRWRLRTE